MGLYLLIPTLIVVMAAVLIVRAGAIALRMTGLDDNTAGFQALSAFTRTGFTTREAEAVINHPLRRKIISWLIILGNIGTVAVIVTTISSLVTSTGYRLAIVFAVLLISLYLAYRLARYAWLMRKWDRLVEKRLLKARFFSTLPQVFSTAPQVEYLLQFAGKYGVGRIAIMAGSPFAGGVVKDMLAAGSFAILGIDRQGKWISSPGTEESIDEGDSLILYGALSEMGKVLQG
ncbi:MAG: hypothetical protein ABIH70_03115 [Chloroflexota bacterium]